MTEASKDETLSNLRREVGRIAQGGGLWQDITGGSDWRGFTPAPPDPRLSPAGRTKTTAEREPFGRWLLAQVDREDAIDELAKAARQDPGFPKDGDPDAVRKRLSTLGADPEMHEALDDAELDWASY